MLENVGIFSQKVINDTVTGQQCVVEATIKETLSAIPSTQGLISVIVVNKMSGGNNLSVDRHLYSFSYNFLYLYSLMKYMHFIVIFLLLLEATRKFGALHASFSSSCKGLKTFIYIP